MTATTIEDSAAHAGDDITPDDQLSERVVETARKIEGWRTAHKISKEAMPKRFGSFLKSYRGVERAAAGDTAEMNLQRHLAAFDAVWSLINTPKPKAVERAYEDFSVAARLRDAFLRTMTKTGPNRVILVIGPTGAGKTKAREALMQTWKKRIISVDATKVWKDKPLALLSALWRALGKTDQLGFGPSALARITDELGHERRCVVIDEAHYLGADQLNTVTTLVNSTPGEFILIGQPTLWSRLENDRGVFLEARQLTRNRLSRRISIGQINEGDVRMLIERRLSGLDGADKAARALMQHAPQHGHLAFCRNVIERCEEAVEETAGALDWPLFAECLKDELSER